MGGLGTYAHVNNGHAQETQDLNSVVDLNNEIRFTSLILMFMQRNPNKMVRHDLFLQVYTTKSSIHW